MSESLDVRIERLLDATQEQAFAAWVDVAARLRWYAPRPGMHVEATSDLRAGGEWRAAFGPSKDDLYVETGVYREVDPPRRLVYTQRFQAPDGTDFTTLVTVTFDAHDGKTLFTLVDAGFPDEQSRTTHEYGWPAFIDSYERELTAPAG